MITKTVTRVLEPQVSGSFSGRKNLIPRPLPSLKEKGIKRFGQARLREPQGFVIPKREQTPPLTLPLGGELMKDFF